MTKKNYKKKYVTLEDSDGTNFRELAKIMTNAGYKMNHASSRNILISAIDSMLIEIAKSLEVSLSDEQVKKLRDDQNVHSYLADLLFLAYDSMSETEINELINIKMSKYKND